MRHQSFIFKTITIYFTYTVKTMCTGKMIEPISRMYITIYIYTVNIWQCRIYHSHNLYINFSHKIIRYNTGQYSITFSTGSLFFLFSLKILLRKFLGPFVYFCFLLKSDEISGNVTFNCFRIWRMIPTKSSSTWWCNVTEVSTYLASCWLATCFASEI